METRDVMGLLARSVHNSASATARLEAAQKFNEALEQGSFPPDMLIPASEHGVNTAGEPMQLISLAAVLKSWLCFRALFEHEAAVSLDLRLPSMQGLPLIFWLGSALPRQDGRLDDQASDDVLWQGVWRAAEDERLVSWANVKLGSAPNMVSYLASTAPHRAVALIRQDILEPYGLTYGITAKSTSVLTELIQQVRANSLLSMVEKKEVWGVLREVLGACDQRPDIRDAFFQSPASQKDEWSLVGSPLSQLLNMDDAHVHLGGPAMVQIHSLNRQKTTESARREYAAPAPRVATSKDTSGTRATMRPDFYDPLGVKADALRVVWPPEPVKFPKKPASQ